MILFTRAKSIMLKKKTREKKKKNKKAIIMERKKKFLGSLPCDTSYAPYQYPGFANLSIRRKD